MRRRPPKVTDGLALMEVLCYLQKIIYINPPSPSSFPSSPSSPSLLLTMISRFFLLSAIAFSSVAAQSALIASLLEVPTDIARIALLPDTAFKFDFENDVPARTTGAGGFSSSANSETMPATIGNGISISKRVSPILPPPN